MYVFTPTSIYLLHATCSVLLIWRRMIGSGVHLSCPVRSLLPSSLGTFAPRNLRTCSLKKQHLAIGFPCLPSSTIRALLLRLFKSGRCVVGLSGSWKYIPLMPLPGRGVKRKRG